MVGVWRDAAPILATLDAVRWNVVLVTLSAGLIAAIALYLVFRSAQGRITRQTAALVDALDRDTLTGTLNHGALVALVATGIERARATDAAIGVALIDIDNFRLLNETYGHDAGNEALLTVAGVLRRSLPDDVAFGRYGPDEFLRGRAGRLGPPHDRRPRADARRARRPLAPVRRLRAPAPDRQRRRVPVPRSRRLRHGAPDGHGPDPPGGEVERRRRGPGRRPAESRASPGRAPSTSSRA